MYVQSPTWTGVLHGMIKGQAFLFHANCSCTEKVSPSLLCKTQVTTAKLNFCPYMVRKGEKNTDDIKGHSHG